LLRSLLIGDCDHYLSPYIFGVSQGMTKLGHWHSQISIRQPIEVIAQRVKDLKPHVLWTHMLLWAPQGSPNLSALLDVVANAAKQGTKVIVHDGDYKEKTRHPHDISSWCALALCNHDFDRTAWRCATLKWPYFAFDQESIVPPTPKWACDVFFAGKLDKGPVYAERTAFVGKMVHVRVPSNADGNTLFQTAEIAASAGAVLGFGRPTVKGWVDTRVFQYPGAGGILLHDDVAGYLEPWVHYVPYRSGNVESVLEALARLKALPLVERHAIRDRAFRFVQEKHSTVARVREVLKTLGLPPSA